MSEESKKDGPSKKQLKKLAKKAEKQAAKTAGATKEAGNEGSKSAGQAPPQPAPLPTKAPSLTLVNADEGPFTLKALWASQIFNVPLRPGRNAAGTSGLAHGPALVYGDQLVMGGNGMAKALALMSGESLDFIVDQWCEWERTTLRPSMGNDKKLESALSQLEAALDKSGSRHIVGHKMTVADICVLVTLILSGTDVAKLPPLVSRFVQTHVGSFQAAKESLSSLGSASIDLNNPSMLQVLEGVFRQAIQSVFGDDISLPSSVVGKTQNSKHGDFQCNAAMPIFASLKKSNGLPPGIQSSQDVARALIEALGDKNPVVEQLSVNGPGFVICRIAPSYLQTQMNNFVLEAGKLPQPQGITPTVCVVDFSSPNIAKEMHVGHLRSTIIGEAVCRVLEFVGHDVKRVNHVGDWGTQFGMLIQYLKEEFPNFHEENPNIADLTQFYKSAKGRFDASPEFKKMAQTNVVRLQSGDKECLEIWHLLCDVSRTEFQKVYDRLDVNVEECGESFYNDKIPTVIEEFEEAGMISIEEGGAKCIFVPKHKIPLMLQKSDGGYGYDSTDMAALKYRLQTLGAKRIIVVTDFSQGDHFKMCYSAAEKIGWLDDQKLEHIGFGTVQGEDGKRFKTRSGDTVRLVDLLDEAVSRMDASLKERLQEGKANITEDEVHNVAEAIGYGAVKYFDLRRNPTTNYKFSYDQMLDTKGNTAVYLLYARARLESICTKAKNEYNIDVDELIKNKAAKIVLGHPSERNLALNLHMFTDTIESTLEDLFPYHICEYLYNVAIAASEFATQCKVLGSPEMESRLLMCRATTMAMHQCFDLLGIRHVMRI